MPFQAKSGSMGRPPKQTIYYSVTFELHAGRPTTCNGTVLASHPARTAYLAVREAKKQAKGLRWDSFVVVVDKHGPLNTEGAS